MLTSYIQAALRHAQYEWLSEDEMFYADIEGLRGVYATGKTIEMCREELVEVLEEWILLSVAKHLPIPEIDGVSLSISHINTVMESI